MYELVRVVGYEWDNSVDILYVVIAVILQQMEYPKITSKHCHIRILSTPHHQPRNFHV